MLIAVAAAYTVLRHLEFARMRDVNIREKGAVYFAFSTASAAITWTLLSWLLHWPLGWLAHLGWLGLVPLALLGAALGYRAMPEVALGAAITYTWWRPEPDLVLWWALPIIVGCTVHWAMNFSAFGSWSIAGLEFRMRRNTLQEFLRYVVPPGLVDRAVRWLALTAYTTPIVLWFAGDAAWPGLVAAVLVTLNLWISDWNLRILLRPNRSVSRQTAVAWLAAVVVLAATLRLDVDISLSVSITAALVVVVQATATHVVRRRATTLPRTLRLLTILVYLARSGAVVLVVSALLHPGDDQLTALLPSLVAVLAANASGAFNMGLSATTMQDARRMVSKPPPLRAWLLGTWAYDTFLGRSGPNNLSFVLMLLNMAQLTGRADYLVTADQALDLVENEVLPQFDDDSPLHAEVARVRELHTSLAV